MNTEQLRADFEAWAASIGFCVTGKYAETIDVMCAESAFKAGYRAALQSQPRTEPSEWLKQHEALMHRVSKAALVVGYGGTINGSAAEQTLENAEKALLDHARALQSQDREDAERMDWLESVGSVDIVRTLDNKAEVYAPHNDLIYAAAGSLRAAIDHARRVGGGVGNERS